MTLSPVKRLVSLGLLLGLALPALAVAQEANIAFGALRQDTSLPVEITSDSLSVNNADGTAVFIGNVRVGQGEMRLSAAEVQVEYEPEGRAIKQLHAKGGVTLASKSDAAESREAVYTIGTGQIVMTGDVLLAQGQSALSGQKLTIHLKEGRGVMEGGVSTTFLPGGN